MSERNKNRKRSNTTVRADYTKGGRVQAQVGGIQNQQFGETEPLTEDNRPKGDLDRGGYTDTGPTGQFNFDGTTTTNEQPDNITPDYTEGVAGMLIDPKEREKRIERTSRQVEQAARGILPRGAKQGPISEREGTAVREDIDFTMPSAARLEEQRQLEAEQAPTDIRQDVTRADPSVRVKEPEMFAPSTFDAAKADRVEVGPSAKLETLTPEAQAEVDEVRELTRDAAGVQVEVEPGAVQARVVGTLSPESKAQAAKVAGTSLPRVTRAKSQLRNAGLSEEMISEIGNDPEALEARLMDLTEEERGLVEGLPVDALVSTQLDGLLSGIENGEIPTWARPAVASVEQMLAQRGMSASTVGRDSLFNAIIQSAIPLAQSNAQAIQSNISQQKNIEAQAEVTNAQFRQQTAQFNAQNVFNMDMAQFNADQQRAINNSKFFQTTSLTEANNNQQAAIQNAVATAQLDLATVDQRTKLSVQNAQAFLQMDMQNLANDQQMRVIQSQIDQQKMLSDQAAENASRQFNATSENQTNQFLTNLATQVNLNNAQRMDAMNQFNTSQANAAAAQDANRRADIEKFNAQLVTQIDQYNSQQEFQRQQFNASNALAIEQSNVQWRRQANTINTAAQNAINQQNAQNAFNLSNQALSNLWQELRDQADYDFKTVDNEEQRKTALYVAALGNEGASYKGKNWAENISAIGSVVNQFTFGSQATTNPYGPIFGGGR